MKQNKAVNVRKVSQYISQYNILRIKLQSVNREARWQSSLLCGLWRRLYWEALGGGRRGCKTCSGWFKILLNNCLSAVEHRVAKSSISLSQTPDRLLLLRKACSFCQSVALEKPIQELDAYSNLWERQIYRYCGGHYHATHVHVKPIVQSRFAETLIVTLTQYLTLTPNPKS